jgi:LPS-assembly protein
LSSKPLIVATCLLAAFPVYGAETRACRTTLAEPLSVEGAVPAAAANPGAIVFEAGRLQAQLGDEPTAILSGGVLLRTDDKLAGADTARYEPDSQEILLEGGVRYEDPSTQIISDSAEFAYRSGRIRFSGAQFSLGSNGARGASELLEINQDGTLRLDDVEYTTCPPGSEDWLLHSKSIKLDTGAGIGTAKGIKLQFKGVPILYAPYLSFPISDARKSGLLIPEIGSAGRSGNEIRVPYYFNIAPNYDATVTPRLLTSRGLQLETQFRYLTPNDEGILTADYLPDDSILDAARHQLRFQHRTDFSNGWRNRIDYRKVSDSQYFEDLGGSLSVSSTTHLNRSIRFGYYGDNFSMLGQVQEYQTIDDAILPADQPYQRLPQVLASGSWPLGLLRLNIDGEVVNFDREVGVTGWRVNAMPSVELPVRQPGWFVTPAVALDHTRYQLDDTLPGANNKPTRTVPIMSLDTGMVLERTMNTANRVQTLEPRVLYVNIPYREQSDLPVFDTITPDINLVQLYRKNRFLGVDRIGDTDQLSIGITSRILDVATGRELMTATIGQTRCFGDRNVTLPGNSASTLERSDYIAQLRFLLWENVNFDIGHQWGTGTSDTTKSEARLQYQPANNKILNIAYRFRRDSLEQGDLSWSWPVKKRWNFVGRYNFSFRDDEVLEQFFGLEYESCCWGLRLVSRRHISTRDGTRDSSFGLQLVLKGMTSVGTAADKLLERGILGYSADLR